MPRRPPGSDATSVWLRPAHATRQPVPAFSRDEITRVAIELADQGGLEAVSMRRIAARIGSAPTSLYWYFSDKDELYELMADAVLGEIPLPEHPSGDWYADLAAIARAVRTSLSRHSWYAQIGIHPVAGPQTRRFIVAAVRAFEGVGLSEQTTADIFGAVNNYISGFIQREAAWDRFAARASAASTSPPGAPGADVITPEVLAARTQLSSDASFEFGLRCLLDGIATHIAHTTGSATGNASAS
jgi:AcrR family transcriptional regulator